MKITKTTRFVALCLSLLTAAIAAAQQAPSDEAYQIVARGASYRIWQKSVPTTNTETGAISQQVHAFTELQDGMHYQNEKGEWIESQDLIEISPSGSVAVHGQMKAIIRGDITANAAITLTTIAGEVFQSHPIGLFYDDPISGKVARVAAFQASQALLYPPNTIVFSNALSGLNGDLMVVWTAQGYEQNVVLKQKPPAPESFGLSSADCRLQMWSALDAAPSPREQRSVKLKSGLVDHILVFDGCWFPVGSAFAFGDSMMPAAGQPSRIHLASPSDPETIPVAKSLVTISDRTLLIEEVKLVDVLALLQNLPTAALSPSSSPAVEFAARVDLVPDPAEPSVPHRPVEIASAPYSACGMVLDYTTLSSGQSSFTFTNGATYYIPTNFSVGPGTATFQSASCVKFATNAYLLAYGPVSFPTSGAQVIFSSKDDNLYGAPVNGSTGVPYWAAAQSLWMYYLPSTSLVQNAVFRWAGRAVQYDGGTNDPWLVSSAFQNCSTGLYVNIGSPTLHVRATGCNVATPIVVVGQGASPVDGSMTNDCAVLNLSKLTGIQAEPAIAVNPANPSDIFLAANHSPDNSNRTALFTAYSHDGGATWTSSTNTVTNACCDASASFDVFGNLFLCYIGYVGAEYRVIVLLSTNGGSTFSAPLISSDYGDQPTLATGPGATSTSSVWITYSPSDGVYARGAAVTGLGTAGVGTWTSPAFISGSYNGYWGDIAIGPTGQVAVTFQNRDNEPDGPTDIYISVDSDGVGTNGFTAAQKVVTSQEGSWQLPPAAPNWGVDAEPGLAWDCTSGAHRGRLYMVFTDRPATNLNNQDTYVTYSDDMGTNWSTALQVNQDSTTTSQFDPRISIDQTSGNLAVSWYDCRGDTTNNVKATFYAAVSRDGGASFSANFRLEPGQSDATLTSPKWDYFDYTGLAYYGGLFYPAWADNSNSTGDNPDTTAQMDIYVARVPY